MRPLRITYPGALYHVMSRGNAYQNVYTDNRDRQNFLNILKDVIDTHNLICHAYCLMDNHYHLLLETPDGNLPSAMRDINGNYTQKFNQRHQLVGHLFQGRYKSHLIEKEPYLLQVARYIVLNPIRAKKVKHPMDWKWSSYNSTSGTTGTVKWLSDWLLGVFSDNIKQARKEYINFVLNGIGLKSPFEETKEGIILGSPQFIFSIWEDFNDCEEIKEIKKSDRMVSRPSLHDIFCNLTTTSERNKMIQFARIRAAYSITDIADHLGLNRSTVSRIFNKND